mmetsp:Transcript_20853/g.21231  ORF Transcript_20853/g.21231 Transcript_20853/m.21231 type:complete len:91 (+) Transcript_20853:583-855(+)
MYRCVIKCEFHNNKPPQHHSRRNTTTTTTTKEEEVGVRRRRTTTTTKEEQKTAVLSHFMSTTIDAITNSVYTTDTHCMISFLIANFKMMK